MATLFRLFAIQYKCISGALFLKMNNRTRPSNVRENFCLEDVDRKMRDCGSFVCYDEFS